jgi:hypothetical protein
VIKEMVVPCRRQAAQKFPDTLGRQWVERRCHLIDKEFRVARERARHADTLFLPS